MIMCKGRVCSRSNRLKQYFQVFKGSTQSHNGRYSGALGEAMQPSFKEYAKQVVKNAKALS
jgi:glycine/serine hydroxymethyltransferase